MKLIFFDTARAVTGSCHCVECGGKKALMDYGLQQSRGGWDNQELDFAAGYIGAVMVTHAHIDHSGRIPLLAEQGFTSNIYCTHLTGQLLSIMLWDSVHIRENDAQWQNQKGKRAEEEPAEPLYAVRDAEEAAKRIVTYGYGTTLQTTDGVKVCFVDAGHLLSSTSVEMQFTEGGDTRKVVFSGDIGNRDQPIIHNPQYIRDADYVLTESTYSNRLHDMNKDPDYIADLAATIDRTPGNGDNVIAPSFVVGHTQELLYFIREMKEQGLVKGIPDFSVMVDSPLADEAARIFFKDLHDYLDKEAIAALKGGALFQFPDLTITENSDGSRALNLDPTPKVIISASGTCDAGRIRHHLKRNLWRPGCAMMFMGYQAEGSLGRRLLNGVGPAKLLGEEIAMRAQIVNLHGLSSHADQNGLLRWIEHFSLRPRQVFVIHGDQEVTGVYANTPREEGLAAYAPNYEEVYDLLDNRILSPSLPPEKKPEPASGDSPTYQHLEDVGRKLMEVTVHNRGGASKDLGRFADQLRVLIGKQDR